VTIRQMRALQLLQAQRLMRLHVLKLLPLGRRGPFAGAPPGDAGSSQVPRQQSGGHPAVCCGAKHCSLQCLAQLPTLESVLATAGYAQQEFAASSDLWSHQCLDPRKFCRNCPSWPTWPPFGSSLVHLQWVHSLAPLHAHLGLRKPPLQVAARRRVGAEVMAAAS